MKKLLSLLGAIGLAFSASATVIACSNDSSKAQEDTTETGTKIVDGPKLKLDAAGLLKIIDGDGDGQLITNGKPNEALKAFMNNFAYAFEKNFEEIANKNKKDHPDAAESLYANDNFPKAVTNIFKQLTSRANDAWDAQIRQKKNEYGKDYESKFLKELKEDYDVDFDKIEDYKDNFVFRYATAGQGNNSIRDVLNLISDEFGKGTGFTTPDGALSRITVDLLKAPGVYGGQKVNFIENSYQTKGIPTGTDRQKTWFGQFDNYLIGLEKQSHDNSIDGKRIFNESVSPLIQIINLTGGMDFEHWLEVHKSSETSRIPNSFLVDDVVWADAQAIKENILNDQSKFEDWSNKLVKRMDSQYEEHFGNNNTQGGSKINHGIVSLNASGLIPELPGAKYNQLFSSIPNLAAQEANEQLNGLFSNSQRYFANQYYTEKKPVAITEFVVKPFFSNPKIGFDKEVTNSPYVGTSNSKYRGLQNFIKIFINSSIPSDDNSGAADQTKDTFKNDSMFSWDVLLQNKGKLENIAHNGNENNKDSWTPLNNQWFDFASDLSAVEHSNLLTIDSTSYSNTLKYSVYDFLQKENPEAEEWKAENWNNDLRKIPSGHDFDWDRELTQEPNKKAAKSITNLIHALDRSGTTNAEGDSSAQADKNVYQVLNAEQGIIAFTADDGIHFARIEGYKLLKDADKLLSQQNRLTVENNKDTFKKNIDQFSTHYQLNAAINDKKGDASARAITYDYLNRDTYSQNQSKIKYSDLNANFGNKYLEFLANTSILSTRGDSAARYKYSLKREVQNWLSTNTTADDKNWIAVWDYAKEVLKIKEDKDLFALFFVHDNNKNSLQYRYENTMLDILEQTRNRIKWNPTQSLTQQWTAYQDAQLNLAPNFDDTRIIYRPWNFISVGKEASKAMAINESSLWHFDNEQKTIFYNFDQISLFLNLQYMAINEKQTPFNIKMVPITGKGHN